jgi:polyhydroxybutyrate depolymerase
MSGRRGARLAGLLVVVLLAACRDDEAPTEAPTPPAGTAGCRHGAPLDALRGVRRDVQVGTEVRSYLLDVPAGPPDAPRPVLLAFHGFRATPRRLRRGTGLGRGAQRRGMIAVFPEGHDGVELLGTSGRGWDVDVGETRDLAFVTALLDALEREWCVDRRRVFATGMSNGAFFANLLGCVLGGRLAAIAPVAGAQPLPACPDPRPLPVLLIHGGRDKVVDVALARSARDWWMRTNGCTGTPREEAHCRIATDCRADVTYCEGPQGHTWPRPATRRILGFFEAHGRP